MPRKLPAGEGIRFQVRLPRRTLEEAKVWATRCHMTTSEWVRRAVVAQVESEKKYAERVERENKEAERKIARLLAPTGPTTATGEAPTISTSAPAEVASSATKVVAQLIRQEVREVDARALAKVRQKLLTILSGRAQEGELLPIAQRP